MRRISATYQRSQNFIHRTVAKVDVLVPFGAGVADFNGYIELNPTASAIWDFLKEPRSVEEITDMLVETFEVSVQEAQADAEEFLQVLQEQNMVTLR